MIASVFFEISILVLRCYKSSKIHSRKRGKNDALNTNEEKQLVEIGHPLTLYKFRLKVTETV